MSNKFNPNNKIIRLCMLGMGKEDQGNSEEASEIFRKAWNESVNEFEKFIVAYHIAKYEKDVLIKMDGKIFTVCYKIK